MTYEEAIIARYERSSALERSQGREWYAIARAEARAIAREHGVSFRRAAGLIAALSAGASWKANLTMVRRALDTGTPKSLSQAAVAMASRILAGERPADVLASGQKVSRFYRNILGDTETVTIDRWAARAAGSDIVGSRYGELASAYVRAARAVGERPADLQAIVWIQIRGSAV